MNNDEVGDLEMVNRFREEFYKSNKMSLKRHRDYTRLDLTNYGHGPRIDSRTPVENGSMDPKKLREDTT